ncbi:MAG TPA: cytochrome c oxidase subunit II [Planctomycetota bacterium]|nr:cytochrome c oxidase subunit II [Planctomycetota bacterium]
MNGPLADFLAWVRAVLHFTLNLPVQAADTAPPIDRLHYLQFSGFTAIGIVVLGSTLLFSVLYRRRRGDPTRPTPRVEAPLWLELAVVGLLLFAFVSFWVIGFAQFRSVSRAPENAMEVYVTARQWVWKFAYAEGPGTVGALYVPEGRPVRLVITSRDVIHSFYVPAFRVKMDAVPGRTTTTWFRATRQGRYQILCAELCGAGHSRMWGEVVVLPAERFARWLETGETPPVTTPLEQPSVLDPRPARDLALPTLARRGLMVAAEQGCLACHTLEGSDHIGPTWRGLWGRRVRLQSGQTVIADPAYLTRSMMDPEAEMVEGYPPLMPTFMGRLTPAETAALIELIRSLDDDLTVPPEILGGLALSASP